MQALTRSTAAAAQSPARSSKPRLNSELIKPLHAFKQPLPTLTIVSPSGPIDCSARISLSPLREMEKRATHRHGSERSTRRRGTAGETEETSFAREPIPGSVVSGRTKLRRGWRYLAAAETLNSEALIISAVAVAVADLSRLDELRRAVAARETHRLEAIRISPATSLRAKAHS